VENLLDPAGFNEIKKCRYGTFLFNRNDWPIGTSLREYGEYAFEELTFLQQLLTPESWVVDAGANIGTHTVWFAQHAAYVVSFEPQRIAFQTLNANIALNSLLNVHTFYAAVGDKNGHIMVPVRDQNKPNNFGGVPLAGTTEGERTPLVTLDSLNLPRCDLIKVDVEGMEAEFLVGAILTINHFRPILYMEADGEQAKEAIGMLFEWGYDCYWSVPNLFNPHNIENKREDVFMNASGRPICSINMLAVPKERNTNVIGLKKIESADEQPAMAIVVPPATDEIGRAYYALLAQRQQENGAQA